MSEPQSDSRAIDTGIPNISDVGATSGPVQERFLERAAPWLNRARILPNAG
jgi:hypothetical protein